MACMTPMNWTSMNSTDPSPAPATRILIAEDSATQAQRLKHILEQHGFEVAVASNGRRTLEMAPAFAPALIISDVVMPEMDGFELCRRLKSTPGLAEIPVILVTTLSDPQDVIRGLECRADNFILKPYDERYLLGRVHYVLINREMRRTDEAAMGVEIHFHGTRHFIRADRLQILNLLLSTYEAAIERNRELGRTQDQLQTLNAKLQAANAELQAANARIEEQNRMKSDFLATMSHELRTPLNAIIGFSELLRDGVAGETTDEQRDFLNEIFDSGQHLLALIDDILDLSKIEAGKMELHAEPLELEPLLNAALGMVQQRADARRMRLIPDIERDLPQLRADARKVRQIVYNLLSNAVKFTGEGGSVTLRARRSCNADRAEVEIAVEDTGVGIAPADQTRLFQSFVQIDGSLSRQFRGTGLGLAIVKQLAELHGGRVGLVSAPGVGSTFSVWLPCELATDRAS